MAKLQSLLGGGGGPTTRLAAELNKSQLPEPGTLESFRQKDYFTQHGTWTERSLRELNAVRDFARTMLSPPEDVQAAMDRNRTAFEAAPKGKLGLGTPEDMALEMGWHSENMFGAGITKLVGGISRTLFPSRLVPAIKALRSWPGDGAPDSEPRPWVTSTPL